MCHDVLWSVVENPLPCVQTGLSSRVRTSSNVFSLGVFIAVVDLTSTSQWFFQLRLNI